MSAVLSAPCLHGEVYVSDFIACAGILRGWGGVRWGRRGKRHVYEISTGKLVSVISPLCGPLGGRKAELGWGERKQRRGEGGKAGQTANVRGNLISRGGPDPNKGVPPLLGVAIGAGGHAGDRCVTCATPILLTPCLLHG